MAGEDPASVAGEFGACSFYKNLGYYSLVGLLRLHCQMGDYHTALLSVKNVQLSKKVTFVLGPLSSPPCLQASSFTNYDGIESHKPCGMKGSLGMCCSIVGSIQIGFGLKC